MSTMATFREIVAVRKQMESHVADARELKCLGHRLTELRGMHASGINADILAQIISWLPLPNLAYPSNIDAPLNVSQVCRTWRYSAVSNSALWTKLHFYEQRDPLPPDFTRPRIAAAVKAWAIWLARSRSSPLLIRFDPKFIQWPSDEYKEIDELLVMTLSHQRRWKHIDIGFPHKVYGKTYTYKMCDMPLLETLSISVHAGWGNPAERVCLDLSHSPRLRELRMFDICCLHDPAPTLGKLSSLSIRNWTSIVLGLTWNNFIETVRFAPQLQFIEKLVLSVDDVRDTTELVFPMVREASFELAEVQRGALSHALSQLTMPNLESLDITVTGEDTTANVSSLFISIRSLLLRSKCPLTSLSLCLSSYGHTGSDDTTHVTDLLSMIPELRHLSLQMYHLGDAFLHALTITPGSAGFEPDNLCPGLESISLPANQYHRSSEGFCQMVASRWRAGRTLRKVSIFYLSLNRANTLMIRAFISEGLVIEGRVLYTENSEDFDRLLGACYSPFSSEESGSPFSAEEDDE